jgi:hypothetical protein
VTKCSRRSTAFGHALAGLRHGNLGNAEGKKDICIKLKNNIYEFIALFGKILRYDA